MHIILHFHVTLSQRNGIQQSLAQLLEQPELLETHVTRARFDPLPVCKAISVERLLSLSL